MAQKRIITSESEEERRPQGPKPPAREVPWTEWVVSTYSRYWYVVACFFVDIMVFTELERSGGDGLALGLAALVVLVFGETLLFLRIWPKKASEGNEDEEKGFL